LSVSFAALRAAVAVVLGMKTDLVTQVVSPAGAPWSESGDSKLDKVAADVLGRGEAEIRRKCLMRANLQADLRPSPSRRR
jgi:hypothetical protein